MSDLQKLGISKKSCIIKRRLDGKLAIVTGANAGIGFHTTAELTRRGATVIMACRNMEKAEKAKLKILETYGSQNPNCLDIDVASVEMKSVLSPVEENQLIIEQIDLICLDSIRAFANRIKGNYLALDYLVNNAGLTYSKFELTKDNFEITMAANYLGPFLLTHLLIPLMQKPTSDKESYSRIINVSSMCQRRSLLNEPNLFLTQSNYSPFGAYCNSKLANTLHAIELSQRLNDHGILVVSLHPGLIKTNIGHNIEIKYKVIGFVLSLFTGIDKWQGCQTTLYTILTDNIVNGGYYSDCQLNDFYPKAKDDNLRTWLWNKSLELLNLPKPNF